MRIPTTAGPRTLALALSLVLAAGCASTSQSRRAVQLDDPAQIRALFDSLEAVRIERSLAEANRNDGPRIELWTDATQFTPGRVKASFRLEDDAYVALFNVARDGRITMLYPETPEDPTLLRAGYTYKLPEFFPGFGNRGSGLGRSSYYATGVGARSIDEGGYVFAVASWSPLRLDRLEEMDLLDNYRTASFAQLQPYNVMHEYAELLVPRGKRWYTVKYKYYGEQGGSLFASRSAQCGYSGYGSTGWSSLGSNVRLISSFLGNASYSPFLITSMLHDIAMDGCDGDRLARAYLMALASGFGRNTGGQPGFPQIPLPPTNPPTSGGDPTGGTGSQPAPPEHPTRDGGRAKKPVECTSGKCDEPVDRPRRGEVAEGGEHEAIQLGGRRRVREADAGAEAPRGWSVRDRELPRAEGPRAYRARGARVDDGSIGRGSAPRVHEAGSANGTRAPRPRPEARADQPPPVERPRAEPVRQAEPQRQAPPPRVERSEPPPRPVERTEPQKPAEPAQP